MKSSTLSWRNEQLWQVTSLPEFPEMADEDIVLWGDKQEALGNSLPGKETKSLISYFEGTLSFGYWVSCMLLNPWVGSEETAAEGWRPSTQV